MSALGHYSDHGWASVLVMLASILTTLVIGLTSAIIWVYLCTLGAFNEEYKNPDADPTYGFWFRGNLSIFNPAISNRTDLNTSSPTYGLWTPPPEWRDHCIRSGGVPLSMCSYFMADEFPAFMIFYHVFTNFVLITFFLFKTYACFVLFRPKNNFICLAMKSAKVWTDWATPWGCNKNPSCKQLKMNEMIARFFFWWTSVSWQLSGLINSFNSPGMGLKHTFHTGKWYYGANWNNIPLQMTTTLTGQYWFRWMPLPAWLCPGFFYYLASQEWADLFDAMVPLGAAPWVYDQVNVTFEIWYQTQLIWFLVHFTSPKDETYGTNGQRQIVNSINGPGLKGFIVANNNSIGSNWFFATFTVVFLGKLLLINNQTAVGMPEYSGEEGKMAWLQVNRRINIVAFCSFAFLLGLLRVYYWRIIAQSLEAGKKIMSAANYQKKAARFKWDELTIALYFGVYILLVSFFLPRSLALNIYGDIYGNWYTIGNLIFTQDTAVAANMLAGPINQIITRTWLYVMFYFWFAKGVFSLLMSDKVKPKNKISSTSASEIESSA